MSSIEKALIHEYATAAGEAVVTQVIATLKSSKATLSGDDSKLVNVWEEICAQMQGEESFYWDTYLETMRDLVLMELEKLPARDLTALWLKTDEGWDWQYDLEQHESNAPANSVQPSENTSIPYQLEHIADYLVQEKLLSAAENYTNKNISAFLKDDEYSEEDEDDDSEDEDDDNEDEDMDDLRERLVRLMPLDSVVLDLWDWDIHFENETFDDITEPAFCDNDELPYYAHMLAGDFLRWIDKWGMDYNQSDATYDEFSEFIREQCFDFMTKWRANVKKEFNR